MRAAIYTGIGGVECIAIRSNVPDPELGSNDALIDVAYAGLNRADILERRGRYPAPPRDPTIPGLEFAGTVRAIGPRVTNVTVGERVCGLVEAGAHASRLATNALSLAPIPDGVALRDAAALPETFITAHDALFARGAMRLGDWVLVHAVGSGVGLAALALAKLAGARTIGTSRTASKLERARPLGLDAAVLFGDGWLSDVMTATTGRGVDVILDFAGASTLDNNCRALASGGRIVQIGMMAGARATFDLGTLLAKRASLHGTVLRLRPLEEKIALHNTFARDVLPLFNRHELVSTIDTVFPLERLADAHRHMENDANFGKILIAIGGDASV